MGGCTSHKSEQPGAGADPNGVIQNIADLEWIAVDPGLQQFEKRAEANQDKRPECHAVGAFGRTGGNDESGAKRGDVDAVM